MKKTLLVLTLVAILFAGLLVLTGCGNDSSKSAEPAKTTETSDTLQVPMTFVNAVEDTTIMKLYVSGAGVDNWGDELLKGQQMPTGTQLQLTLGVDKNNVKWDIKVEDEEGTEVTFRNLDISEVSTSGGTITLSIEDGTPVATAK